MIFNDISSVEYNLLSSNYPVLLCGVNIDRDVVASQHLRTGRINSLNFEWVTLKSHWTVYIVTYITALPSVGMHLLMDSFHPLHSFPLQVGDGLVQVLVFH